MLSFNHVIWVSMALFFNVGGLAAKEVNITIGSFLPPYVISSEDSGIEVDIIRSAFKAVGHTVSFNYVPTGRLLYFVKNNPFDGVVENSSYDMSKELGGATYTSNTIISLQNVVIALKKKQLIINEVEDLSTLKIIAFQHASKYLGQDFLSVIHNNPEYKEHAHQHLQIRQLYANKVDAVITDKRIFMYWRKLAYNKGQLLEESITESLIIYPLFIPSARNLKTLDKKINDDFNTGLDEIKQNGTYQAILDKYKDGNL